MKYIKYLIFKVKLNAHTTLFPTDLVETEYEYSITRVVSVLEGDRGDVTVYILRENSTLVVTYKKPSLLLDKGTRMTGFSS